MIKEAELPAPQEDEASSPELLHRICSCRENVALCGRYVADETLYEYGEVAPDPDCPECVAATPRWLCPVCLYRWDEVDG